MVEAVLRIQLGLKCSVKMKSCDPMYRGKARIRPVYTMRFVSYDSFAGLKW